MLANLAQVLMPLFLRGPEGIIGRTNGSRGCVVEDQRVRALRVRRGEERANLAALTGSEERRCLRPRSVEDGANVVHSRFQRSEIARAI